MTESVHSMLFSIIGIIVILGIAFALSSGKRHISLKFSELEDYRGERGRRGNKLPRGFQKVDSMRAEA